MTYDEYLSKRQKMEDQAQTLILEGTKESLAKSDEILDQISKLDEQYTAETRLRMANERALNNEPQMILMPWMTGESLDVTTGQWNSPELKDVVTTTSSGTLIPSVLSAQIIDLMRNLSLFAAAGVPVAAMETNNLTISRVKADPTFKFKQEGEAAEESSFELDGVELKTKTAYGYAYVTLEAIQSSRNLDTVLRQVFAAAMANAIDIGMLYGQKAGSGGFDSFAPAGIMNDVEILTVQSGETPSYDDIVKAAGAIRRRRRPGL